MTQPEETCGASEKSGRAGTRTFLDLLARKTPVCVGPNGWGPVCDRCMAGDRANCRYPDGVAEPKRCKECNATGLWHCQHPDECGGPWDKKHDAGVPVVDGKTLSQNTPMVGKDDLDSDITTGEANV